MTVPRQVRTVLFDVDGTLIDSNGAHAEAWRQSLQEHGIGAEIERIRGLIGMGGDKLLPAVAGVAEESDLGQSIAHRKKDVFGSLLPNLQPTPGARPLLEYLRQQQVDVVIATSADGAELGLLLQRAGVDDLIPMRASKDDAASSKPDPDIVRAAMVRSEAHPESTVMVGDTPYDVEAARRAGIRAIALRCGGHWSDHALAAAGNVFDHPRALLVHWRDTLRGDGIGRAAVRREV